MLAMLMSPVCSWLDRKGVRRIFSTIICIFILLSVFAFVVGVIIIQVTNFQEDLPLIEQKTNTMINSVHNYIEREYDIPVEQQKTILQKQVKNSSESSASYITNIIAGATGLIASLTITLVITFLLLYDKEKYETFFLRLLRENDEEVNKEVLNKITLVAQKYLTGRAISMLVLFILYLISLLAIGVKNALLLSVIAAIVNIVPYIGPLVAGVFPVIMALVTNDSYAPAIWVAITFSVIQGIDNYFVTPYVLGGEVNLSALSTIVIIVCGGFIWGIAGMILFIPLLSIVKIVFDQIESLKPYGYLIGDPASESPSVRFKNWLKKRLGKGKDG
jgi:predicted PurR-regulated permease PerM